MNRTSPINRFLRLVLPAFSMAILATGTIVEADIPIGTACDCRYHGDCNGNGSYDVADITLLINHAYRNDVAPETDPDCPHLHRGDWDCNGRINLIDVVKIVQYVFRYPAYGPCNPCGNPDYVGSATCAACHQEIAADFMLSGHAYMLNESQAALQPGYYPFGNLDGPPPGYRPDQISYVLGGFRWKARFIDRDGFIITGADAAATTQWNLPTQDAPEPEWVGYHPGEEWPYDCGPCHMTAYNSEGHQEDLPGMVGTWELDGIQCEECHGPGEFHTADPEHFPMAIDRSSEQCGKCHVWGDVRTIPASGGFIRNHAQWNEIYAGGHIALTCVDCHNPHQGLHEHNPQRDRAIHTPCESCHPDQDGGYRQSVLPHYTHDIECIDCHMPQAAKSARQINEYKADVRSHLMVINTNLDAPMFSPDSATALGYLTIDFVCRQCHTENSLNSATQSGKLIHPQAP